jgi:hypothetical protein
VRCAAADRALRHDRVHVHVVDVPVRDRPGDADAGLVIVVDVHGQPGAADTEYRQLRLHLHRIGPSRARHHATPAGRSATKQKTLTTGRICSLMTGRIGAVARMGACS